MLRLRCSPVLLRGSWQTAPSRRLTEGAQGGRARFAALAAFLLLATPAYAAAPPPARPTPPTLYSGRWYEIARTPNFNQRDCQGASSDFSHLSQTSFTLTETCHKGGPDGPAKTIRATARILPGALDSKFKVSFFAGLVRQEYWILDHADDGAWAIMATPGGNYVWLLARRPVLPASVKAAGLARIAALGYPLARLVYPAQAHAAG